MTAAELYEVVKDVPREAWPKKLRNHSTFDPAEPERFWIIYGPLGGDDKRCIHITADIAAEMFIGSMTAWLLTKDEMDLRPESNARDLTYVSIKHGWTDWVGGKSLVAALAAACKEAA